MSATIDPKQLQEEPATRLAVSLLKQMGVSLPTRVHPLMGLLAEYLLDDPEAAEAAPDLNVRVAELEREPQGYQVSLLVPDQEQLQADLQDQPGEELQVLKEHLGQLFQSLTGKSPQAAARVLAENLNNSLATLFPSFGPQQG